MSDANSASDSAPNPEEAGKPEPPHLALAPYIPVVEATSIGHWALVPFTALAGDPALPDDLAEHVLRIVEAYRLPHGGGSTLGAVAYPASAQIGSTFDPASLPQLSQALLAGALSGNPALADPDPAANAGWAMCTSENALVYGHRLVDPRSYAISTGVLATVTDLRRSEQGEPLPRIEAPIELPKPLFSHFDHELAGATFAALSTGTDVARRLRLALDWYRVTLSNAEAVTAEVRVGAARSAIEVLMATGNETRKVINRLAVVMSDPAAETTSRTVEFWRGPKELTDDQWWLAQFTSLRNAIVHGDVLPKDAWLHEGSHHVAIAHDLLVRLLRRVIAEAEDDPPLRLAPAERMWERMADRANEVLRRTDRP